MQFLIGQIVTLILAIGAVAPVAQAQALSNSCYSDSECPRNQQCIMSNDIGSIHGTCQTPRLTPLAPTQSSGSGSENIRLLNPLRGSGNLESFLSSILDFVVRIGTIVVILMVVYVGYEFVTARGDMTKISKARTSLLWTVIGALILLGAKAIAIGIEATVQAISVGR